jgi:aryl-alcohol dehydrogenase-like predicted oxidoreductase
VPIEDTVGAIGDVIKAGYVRYVGLSEVGASTLRRAQAVHPSCDLQIEYSLASRGIEAGILPVCRELGIGITAYGVLSRGLISGHWSRERSAAEKGFRGVSPRFQGENLEKNLALVEQLRVVAKEIGASVAQVAIAWVAAQGDDIVPLIGGRRTLSRGSVMRLRRLRIWIVRRGEGARRRGARRLRSSQRAALVVAYSLLDFLPGVHDERAVLYDRLA